MVQLLNSIYLGAATPSDYGKAAGVVELLPFDYYLGAAVPSHGKPTINVLLSGVSPLTLLNAVKLNYVKAFGKCEQRLLPDGYTQLESLANTSNAYIVTSISLDDNDEIEFWWNAEADGSVFAFSQGLSADGQSFQLANTSSDGIVFDIQNYSPYRLVTNIQAYNNGVKHIVIKNREIFIDGVSYGTSAGSVTSPTSALRLFVSSAGAASLSKFTNRFTVKNKINLIPCKRNSDSVLGMYDTVSGQFFRNSGTGTFTAGGKATPSPDNVMPIWCNNGALKARHQSGLPLGYTQLTYIQSDGRQVINTGYVLQETDSVEVDYILTDLTRTGDKFILGAQPVSDTSIGGFWVETYNSSNVWYIRYGSGTSANTYGSVTPTSQLSGTLAVSKNSFVVNGIKILTPDFVNMPAKPMTIFNRISLDGSIPNNGASAQISEVRVKNGNNLVHRYIAVRNSNNELGMYDLVSGQFFKNAGTGDFTAGNLINDLEIYYDGTVETVAVSTFSQDDYLNAYCPISGKIVAHSSSRCFIVPCKPNTEYRFIFDNTGISSPRCIVTGFTNKPEIGMSVVQGLYSVANTYSGLNDATFTTESNIHYLLFWLMYQKTDADTKEAVNKAILYETSLGATCQPLLSVGTYKDVQNITNGAITRNVGVVVLDGSEGWASYQNGICWAASSYLKDKVSGNSASFSTHYGWASSEPANMQNNKFLLHGTQRLCIKDDRFETVTGFRQFLAEQYNAGTPVIVVYPIKTPTTETVTGQTLSITQGTNIVSAEGSVSDLELEVSYKAYAEVTVEEIEAVNTDENVEVTIG